MFDDAEELTATEPNWNHPLVSRSVSELASEWLEAFQSSEDGPKKLDEAIKGYLKYVVPLVYSPNEKTDCLNIQYDEKLEHEKIFQAFELFLSGMHDPKEFSAKLGSLEPPATICGRVFKWGEPTYSCRDCGLDPTCVLCVDCFRQSAHQKHRYKISTSGGGGCCDCGDPEAWHTNYCCKEHEVTAPSVQHSSELDLEAFKERAKALLLILLEFCHQVLCPDLVVLPEELVIVKDEADALGLYTNELFCTVLYNDEVHTFEQVISTLTRSLDVSKSTAKEYATTIDREGRSLVACADFTKCSKVSKMIEKQTRRNNEKPLKSNVIPAHMFGFQGFGIKTLNWITTLINLSSYYRQVFSFLMSLERKVTTRYGSSLLESVLYNDAKMWIAVRTLWHNCCISGLLKDNDCKKNFARVFTRMYPELMRDFIQDDHEHNVSITSLAVQIFTVPSIAHYLIEEDDIFFKIMHTCMSVYEPKLNTDMILQLDERMRHNNHSVKRALYCINDLQYILSFPPSPWTENLRKGFLHGFGKLLTFLSWMENMDPVERQTTQHVEYEPDWEPGFHLHMRISTVTALVQEWCGSDRTVLIVAYRKILTELQKLYGDPTKQQWLRCDFSSHYSICPDFDVSKQPVSVHKPLSRLFAGLHQRLGSFNLDFRSCSTDSKEALTPQAIIEPALRMQVLVAQVHANMWRRNGYSLLNQVYFYANIKCRNEMLDKDIVLLQFGAGNLDSDEFILQTLVRYGLFTPLQANTFPFSSEVAGGDDDSIRNARQLLDEFLYLLVVVVSARFVSGVAEVSAADSFRKEVIQQLCIEPMTHSSLFKALVDGAGAATLETTLDTAVKEVAVANKLPGPNTVMKFELKPEFYDHYDCYHYHYTKEEQSKAEQQQFSRRKKNNEPLFFPPPRLPPFTKNFEKVINILKCDVLLSVLSRIIKHEHKTMQDRKTKASREASTQAAGDPIMQKTLHLISLGLNEEKAKKCSGDISYDFRGSAEKHKIFELLEDYLKVTSSHSEMIRHVLQMVDSKVSAEMPMEVGSEELVMEKEEQRKRQKKAEEARAKMLAKISAAQKSFMAVNADLFAEEEPKQATEAVEPLEVDYEYRHVLGPNRTPSNMSVDETHICILCQEEQSLSDLSKPFVMAAFVQRSSVYCQERSKLISEETVSKGQCVWQGRDPLFLGPDLFSVPYVSSCGHVMHVTCWQKHYENILVKERRRPYRQPLSFDVEKREFLCPMCDCISNMTLPMTNPLYKIFPPPSQKVPGPFDVWVEGLQVIAKERMVQGELEITKDDHHFETQFEDQLGLYKTKFSTCPINVVLERLRPREAEFQVEEKRGSVMTESLKFNDNMKELITNFMQMIYFIGFDMQCPPISPPTPTPTPTPLDFRSPLMMWQALAFTLIAQEDFARDQYLSFFGSDVPSRKELGLAYFVRSCAEATRQFHQQNPEAMKSHAVKLITTIALSPVELPCLLECDAVSMLVNLTHLCPAVLSSEPEYTPYMGTLTDFFICRLVLLFHITQVLITTDFSDAFIKPMETDASPGDESSKQPPVLSRLEHVVSEVWRISGSSSGFEKSVIDYDLVWFKVQAAVVPFLRCCCKFYEKLTNVAPPEQLCTPEVSYQDLVKFLGLPITFEGLFDSRVCWQLPYRWASHPRVKTVLSTQYSAENKANCRAVALVSYPRDHVQLQKLPTDYADMITTVSDFTCKSNVRDSRLPTTCLVCGSTLCSQCYTCQFNLGSTVGSCTYHSYFCGAGKGIFLRNRDCKVFMLGGKGKGCNTLPPYVDQYGETDQGLRRGNPLYLDHEKFEHLRKLWMSHSLPEEIARYVENSNTFSIAEWHLV